MVTLFRSMILLNQNWNDQANRYIVVHIRAVQMTRVGWNIQSRTLRRNHDNFHGVWCFLWSAPEQTAEQTIKTPVMWDAIPLMMKSLWWLYTQTYVTCRYCFQRGLYMCILPVRISVSLIVNKFTYIIFVKETIWIENWNMWYSFLELYVKSVVGSTVFVCGHVLITTIRIAYHFC